MGRDGFCSQHVIKSIFVVLTPWPNIHHFLGCSTEPQVDEEKDDAHEEADATHNDVSDPQEGILASENACG